MGNFVVIFVLDRFPRPSTGQALGAATRPFCAQKFLELASYKYLSRNPMLKWRDFTIEQQQEPVRRLGLLRPEQVPLLEQVLQQEPWPEQVPLQQEPWPEQVLWVLLPGRVLPPELLPLVQQQVSPHRPE